MLARPTISHEANSSDAENHHWPYRLSEGDRRRRFAVQKVIKYDEIDATRWIVVGAASKRVGSARNPHATNIFSRIKDYPKNERLAGPVPVGTNCSVSSVPFGSKKSILALFAS